MRNFKSLMATSTGFVPRTQAQALQGFTQGLLGPEYYIFRAVNVHPVLEEPWDINEIDRLLAKPDLDPETAVLLMIVFERMVKVRDKELALFAAESINVLERRYIVKIQTLRASLDGESGKHGKRDALRGILQSYRILGRFSFARPELRLFYLGEARRWNEDNLDTLDEPDPDTVGYVQLLMDMNELSAAGTVLGSALAQYPGYRTLRYLAAQLSFLAGKPMEVVRHLELLEIDESQKVLWDIQHFWTGASCRG